MDKPKMIYVKQAGGFVRQDWWKEAKQKALEARQTHFLTEKYNHVNQQSKR